MELDFKTVRALSSPTRIKILNQVLEKEATPTGLSEDVDKTKSTVSSHLDTLVNAGLVEKEDEEGRRRVVYRPTRKAQDIVKGKERKVKFALTSSVLTAAAGIGVTGFSHQLGTKSRAPSTQDYALSAADAGGKAAEAAASSQSVDPATVTLALGVSLLSVAVLGFLYGVIMRKLG